MKRLEIGHGHTVVQVVGAGFENVTVRPWRFARHHWIDGSVEEHRAVGADHVTKRRPGVPPESGAIRLCAFGSHQQLVGRQVEHELSRREIVVWPAVNPEQLRVARELSQGAGVDAIGVRHDLFEDVAHRQIVTVPLVVVDVATGKRGLMQVPDENLVVETQVDEAVRIELDHRHVVYLFELIAAAGNVGTGRAGVRCQSGTSTFSSCRGMCTAHPRWSMAFFKTSWTAGSPWTR